MSQPEPLPPAFYADDTPAVARRLVGALLVYDSPDGLLAGRIVETEAYTQDDPACHAWGLCDENGNVNRDGKGGELFGPPGEAYVYLCYGIHWLLNVVTEPEGTAGAVLIRAVEPLEGIEQMRLNRQIGSDRELTNGPGKLTEAFGIGQAEHGNMLTEPPLYLSRESKVAPEELATSTRIGISKAVDRPWRFFLKQNRFVSRGTPSGA